MFVPSTMQNSELEDDAKIYDASRLTIHQAAADEVSSCLIICPFELASHSIQAACL